MKGYRFGFINKIIVILLLFIVLPLNASGVEERMPIKIVIKSNWNYKSGTNRVIGSYSLKVSGSAKLLKEQGETLTYVPDKLNAIYKLDQRTIVENPDSKCFKKVISTMKASGAVPIQKKVPDISQDRDGGFLMYIFLGNTGKLAASRFNMQFKQGEKLNLDQKESSDNYYANLLVTFKAKYQFMSGPNCETVKTKTGKTGLSFTIAFKEMSPWGKTGSYKWGTKDNEKGFVPKIEIGDYKGKKIYFPPKESGGNYNVHWTFGKVKPVVRIFKEEKDITDSMATDVLVGKKIRLKAKVLPEGYDSPTGKWVFEDPERIVAGYRASKDSAKKIPFTDFYKSEIEFFFVNGKFTGKPEKIEYKGQVDGKEVKAKTTINVFRPKAKMDVKPASTIKIGEYSDKPKQKKGVWQILPGPPGIAINSSITMPPGFSGYPYKVQYVQLVKKDCWGLRKVGCPKYNWLKDVGNEFCIDGRYPYTYGESMEDHPGAPLPELASVFVKMDFNTYLMIKPKTGDQDGDCIWIPLKRVDWGWKCSAYINGDPYLYPPLPWEERFTITPPGFPPARYKPVKPVDWFELPEWTCCSEENTTWKQTSLYTEDPKEKPKDWK